MCVCLLFVDRMWSIHLNESISIEVFRLIVFIFFLMTTVMFLSFMSGRMAFTFILYSRIIGAFRWRLPIHVKIVPLYFILISQCSTRHQIWDVCLHDVNRVLRRFLGK